MTVQQKREGSWVKKKLKNQKEKVKEEKKREHVWLSKDKDMGIYRINWKAKFEKGEIPEKTKGK